MVMDPSSHDSDNGLQRLGAIRVQMLPQEIPQPLELRRESILPAGIFQPPQTLSRFAPVAGKSQEVERR